MKYKKLMLNLKHKHQEKSLIKLTKNYNDVECYLEEDENDSNIKYRIIVFDENNKISKNDRGKIVKQSEFQQYVIEQFKEQKKFNEEQRKFNEEQKNFNELFSKRLDSIENRLDSVETRLTKLESFHEKDIKKNK